MYNIVSDPGLLATIAGTLSTTETRRLESVSKQVRQAKEGAQELRLHELGQDPRVQQLALRVKSHLQKPVVRTCVFYETRAKAEAEAKVARRTHHAGQWRTDVHVPARLRGGGQSE